MAYDALPQQRHIGGPLSATDVKVAQIGVHLSAPADLGYDTRKSLQMGNARRGPNATSNRTVPQASSRPA